MLKDDADRLFSINAGKEPEAVVMKRILSYKDDIFAWKDFRISELSFFMYENGLQAVVTPSTIVYKGIDYRQYLPSDLMFIENDGHLDYRYRIVVSSRSLKIDGTYTGEEPLLEELAAFVNGIHSGRIIVEDERVISGSVISIEGEKRSGRTSIYPVSRMPSITEKSAGVTDNDKRKWFLSAQVSYLTPTGILGDLFLGGFGGVASVGLCDMRFSLKDKPLFTFDVEVNAGFWNLIERKNRDNYKSYKMKSAYIIPIGLTVRHPFGITEHLHFTPSMGFGLFYNSLSYVRTTDAGAEESESAREINPVLMPGIRFDLNYNKLFFFIGSDVMLMFERRINISSLLINAGTGYIF